MLRIVTAKVHFNSAERSCESLSVVTAATQMAEKTASEIQTGKRIAFWYSVLTCNSIVVAGMMNERRMNVLLLLVLVVV